MGASIRSKGRSLVSFKAYANESNTCHHYVLWGKWSLICKLIEILKVPVLKRVISINIGSSRNKHEIQAGSLGTPR